jgi:meso-butanediol dehydrogenase/(S,S)-butanediol dehydrogenase/diacetyl reductase
MTGTSITKVAIVTGAARGIGEAIAVRLASDGYAVAVSDLSSAKAGMENVVAQIVKAGGKAVAIACDVRSKDEVDALVAATVQQLGRLDCMVANAGIAPVGAFMDLKEDVLNSLLDVNVKGVLWCYQAAARAMIEQGEGGKLIGKCHAMHASSCLVPGHDCSPHPSAACSTAGFQGAPGFAGYS